MESNRIRSFVELSPGYFKGLDYTNFKTALPKIFNVKQWTNKMQLSLEKKKLLIIFVRKEEVKEIKKVIFG